ncbi:uncharacterized protein SCHCODRAFT_02579920 [Schizophyllum commune H4-8]|nr:uncharacterized protein SCHCODRAFT_02579920 [Schizophyllum commune H4-8]KAI5890885.1 hypothetical protein SCHCODRAFT_02579920 [Schizophyllum commune H4-8]
MPPAVLASCYHCARPLQVCLNTYRSVISSSSAMSGKRSKPQAKKQVNLAVRVHFCLLPAFSDTSKDYAPGPSDSRWNPAKDPATVFRNEDGGSHAPVGDQLVPRLPAPPGLPPALALNKGKIKELFQGRELAQQPSQSKSDGSSGSLEAAAEGQYPPGFWGVVADGFDGKNVIDAGDVQMGEPGDSLHGSRRRAEAILEDSTTEAAGMEVDGSDEEPLQVNRANEAYVDSDTDEGSVDQYAGGDEEADEDEEAADGEEDEKAAAGGQEADDESSDREDYQDGEPPGVDADSAEVEATMKPSDDGMDLYRPRERSTSAVRTEPELDSEGNSPPRPVPAALTQDPASPMSVGRPRRLVGSSAGGGAKQTRVHIPDVDSDEEFELPRPPVYKPPPKAIVGSHPPRRDSVQRRPHPVPSEVAPGPPPVTPPQRRRHPVHPAVAPGPPPVTPPQRRPHPVPPVVAPGPLPVTPPQRRPPASDAPPPPQAAPRKLPRPRPPLPRKPAAATAVDLADDDDLLLPTAADHVRERAVAILRIESCMGMGLVCVVREDMGYPQYKVVLKTQHGNREIDPVNWERFLELIRTGNFRPRSAENAIVIFVPDGIIDESSLTLRMDAALQTVRLLDGAAGTALQGNGNHRAEAQRLLFWTAHRLTHRKDDPSVWTPALLEDALDPNGHGVCAAVFYRLSVLEQSPYGKQLMLDLVTNNKMGVLGDAPARQLYRLMLQLYYAKGQAERMVVYGDATSNAYSPVVKIIMTSQQQAREILPDFAVCRPFTRDAAALENSFDVSAYLVLGKGFITIISLYWLSTKALLFKGMHVPFTVDNVLERPVGDAEVAEFFLQQDLAWSDIRMSRFKDAVLLVCDIVVGVAEEVFGTIPGPVFLTRMGDQLFDGACDMNEREQGAQWLAQMREAYRTMHGKLKAALEKFLAQEHPPDIAKDIDTLTLRTLPDFIYALSLLDPIVTPITPMKWSARLPFFCPSILHILLKELSKDRYTVIAKWHVTLILSMIIPGIRAQAVRPGITSDKVINLMSPFDLFRAWTIKNAERLGYRGPADRLPLALDTSIMSILSYILEARAFLSDSAVVRDLAGVQSLQSKHTDRLGMVDVLMGVLKQWWNQWVITRRTNKSAACAMERDIPDSAVQQYRKLGSLPDAFLSSPDGEGMLSICLDMLRMWPHGVLCRAADLPSYAASALTYQKTVCTAAVDAFYSVTLTRIFLADEEHQIMDHLFSAVKTAVTEALRLPHPFEPFSRAAIFEPSPADVTKYGSFAAYSSRMPSKEWNSAGYEECEISLADTVPAAAGAVVNAEEGGLGSAPDDVGSGASDGASGREGPSGSRGEGKSRRVQTTLAPPPSVALPRSTDTVHPVFAPTVEHYGGDMARIHRALDDSAREKAQASVQGLTDYTRSFFSSKMKILPSVDDRGEQTIEEEMLTTLRHAHSLACKYIAHFHGGQTAEDREAAHALLLSKVPLPGVAATPEELKAFLDGTPSGKGQAGAVIKLMQPTAVQNAAKGPQAKKKTADSGGARGHSRTGAMPAADVAAAAQIDKPSDAGAAKAGPSMPPYEPSEQPSAEMADSPRRSGLHAGHRSVERGRTPRTLSSGPPILQPQPPARRRGKERMAYKSDEFVREDPSQERLPGTSFLPTHVDYISTGAGRLRLPRAHGDSSGGASDSDALATSDMYSVTDRGRLRLPAFSRVPSPDASSGESRASSKRRNRSPSDDGSPSGEQDEPAKKKTRGKKNEPGRKKAMSKNK